LATLPLGLVACGSIPQMEERLATMAFSPDIYVARPGDTIESVAYRYKLDPAELSAMNPTLVPGESITEATTHPTVVTQAPIPTNDLDYEQIKEIPASANRSQATQLPQSGFIEEVVADDLDYASLPPATTNQLADPNASRNIVAAPSGSSNVGWVWPTYGEVAREFAPSEAGGQGIDIAGVPGQQIKAVSSGTVVYAGRDVAGGDGKLIILRHADGLMTTYSHARQLFVAEDDVVNGGDVIASLGANARNESVLRFEVRQNGNPLNPMQFLGN